MRTLLRHLLTRVAIASLIVASNALLPDSANAFHFPWDQGHDTFTPQCNDPACTSDDNHDHNSCGGGPVDLRTGEYLLLQTPHDITIRGRGPALSLHFTFSGSDRFYNGPFGYGWHTGLTPMAIQTTDGVTNYLTIRQPSGRRLLFIQDATGQYVPPPGFYQNVTIIVDGTISVRELDGTVEIYDQLGRLNHVTDRNGNALTINRDGLGRLTSATDAGGRSLTFTTGANGKIASCSDPLGRLWLYGYDANGHLASVTDPLGGVTRYTYTTNHLMLTFTDPRGTVVEQNDYDSFNHVVRQTMAASDVYVFTYLATNRTSITNPRGRVSVTEYNACCGLPTRETDYGGNVTTREYDANRNLGLLHK